VRNTVPMDKWKGILIVLCCAPHKLSFNALLLDRRIEGGGGG
jgi:hypothetical protein